MFRDIYIQNELFVLLQLRNKGNSYRNNKWCTTGTYKSIGNDYAVNYQLLISMLYQCLK